MLIVGFVLLVSGCGRVRAPALEMDHLFFLDYGKMEDQVELLIRDGAINRKTSLSMRGGLFLIASGYGNRIMEFTSYGDLVTLYYNPSDNARPIMLQTGQDESRVTNRRAYEYSFNVVGDVAVNSNGVLLIEDQVPERVAVFDDELGTLLNRIVVRLNRDGTQIDYLGQEGVGGTFFPYIQRIVATSADDIVVVTTAPPRSIVYWFDSEGDLLRRVDITPQSLPVPAEVSVIPVLESIYPDLDLPRLYLKLNYALSGGGIMSRIYWIDIETGEYEGFVDVPRNVKSDSVMGGLGKDVEYQYEFLGAAPGEHLFLLSQESMQESQLMILHTSGRVVRRRTLAIDYDEIVYRNLDLSSAGILSGLLATRDRVNVVWWRTDRLFEGR